MLGLFVANAKLAMFAVGEMARLETLDQVTFASSEVRDQVTTEYYQHISEQNKAMSEAAKQTLERLRRMTWEEVLENGAEIGVDLLTQCALFGGVGKIGGATIARFASLGTEFKEVAQAEKIAAAAGKASTPITELGQQVAVVGKVSTTYGVETAGEALQTMAADAEFVAADSLGISFKDKVANFFKRFEEKRVGNVQQTGARTMTAEEYLAKEQWAVKKYDEIRQCSTDIQQIAKNTGMLEHQIARIKHHLFVDDTHILRSRVGQFDPDYLIVEAWERLNSGNFIENDLRLLQHELFESRFEKIFKTDYITAHSATEHPRVSNRYSWRAPTAQ